MPSSEGVSADKSWCDRWCREEAASVMTIGDETRSHLGTVQNDKIWEKFKTVEICQVKFCWHFIFHSNHRVVGPTLNWSHQVIFRSHPSANDLELLKRGKKTTYHLLHLQDLVTKMMTQIKKLMYKNLQYYDAKIVRVNSEISLAVELVGILCLQNDWAKYNILQPQGFRETTRDPTFVNQCILIDTIDSEDHMKPR